MIGRCVSSMVVVAVGMLISVLGGAVAAAGTRPNVIVLITDDQGYGDLSCHGNPVLRTPNMDALHAQSVRLTNFHVDPTCSPTRSALMTGCYSHRVKVWHTIIGRNYLDRKRPTMASVFHANGYRTGHFGKWHLGGSYPYRPIDRGFEEWLGEGNGGTGTADDYWNNDRVNDVFIHNGRKEQTKGYAPDVFFNAALQFIRDNKERPFFVYLATYVPHNPWSLPDARWADPYRNRVPLATAYFFASIARLDHNLGRLRQFLAEEGLAENTILIFLTDNGTSGGDRVFNAGMRGKKGSQYEGGHRVPCFVHWPAGSLAAGSDVQQLSAHIDLLPTLMDLCRLEKPAGLVCDGRSLGPLLRQPAADWQQRELVVESQRIPHPQKWRKCAVMTGRWRLIDGKQLYDLDADPGQTRDVARVHPDVVRQLRGAYERYWDDVTVGDDQYGRPILGAAAQPEIMLCSQDWMPTAGPCPWSQAHVASGAAAFGFWPVQVAESGSYRFELRRWPREVETSLSGVPSNPQVADAFLNDEPVLGTLYHAQPRAIPVAGARLKVGQKTLETRMGKGDVAAIFTVDLVAGRTQIETWLLDKSSKELCGAYFVYARRDGEDAASAKTAR